MGIKSNIDSIALNIPADILCHRIAVVRNIDIGANRDIIRINRYHTSSQGRSRCRILAHARVLRAVGVSIYRHNPGMTQVVPVSHRTQLPHGHRTSYPISIQMMGTLKCLDCLHRCLVATAMNFCFIVTLFL